MNDKADLEAKVIEVCAQHESQNSANYRDYRQALRVGDYFVKFGGPDDLLPEIETQKYISTYALSNHGPGVPRIPRVVHSFEHDYTMYLIMEYINLKSTGPDIEAIKAALIWLAGVPAPPGHVLGPLGDGYICHKFFKDSRASLCFSSVEALERYIERARMILPPAGRRSTIPVTITNDRLMFSQSDIDPSNFGVDEYGNTVLMDFGEIGLLPETFVAHTMYSNKDFAPIVAALNLSKEYNWTMCAVSAVLQMVGNPELGLDIHGNPKNK